MAPVLLASLLILTGICFGAGAHHITVGLRRPRSRVHILFGAMCLLLVGFGITQALTYDARSVQAVTSPLKWNLFFIGGFYLLLPWFARTFARSDTGRHWSWLSTVLILVLMLLNVFSPASMQFQQISGLRLLHMPWGEVVAEPAGRPGELFWPGLTLLWTNLLFAAYLIARVWRERRSRAAGTMLIGIGAFILTAIQASLVRAGLLDFIHLGPFGMLAMVLMTSAALSGEWQRGLLSEQRRFHALVDQAPFSIQVLAPDGSARQVNRIWQRLWSVRDSAIRHYNVFEDRKINEKGLLPFIQRAFSGDATEMPVSTFIPDPPIVAEDAGQEWWVESFAYPIHDTDNRITDVIVMHRNVTGQKQVEDVLRRIAGSVSSLGDSRFFDQLTLTLATTFRADYAFVARFDNPAPTLTTLALTIRGEKVTNISLPITGTPFEHARTGETIVHSKGVRERFPNAPLFLQWPVESCIAALLKTAAGTPLGLVAVLDGKPLEQTEQMRDVLEIVAARAGAELERQRAEERMRTMAYEDDLTGLGSRAFLLDRLEREMERSRSLGTGCALIMVDLDHFKTINDALGHDVGDELLRAVAQRLRAMHIPDSILARFGGDDFVILARGARQAKPEMEDWARSLAREVQAQLSMPIQTGHKAFTLGASIGVAVYPDGADSEIDLLRQADMALYHAKHMGRGLVQLYVPRLQAQAAKRLDLEEGLRRAIGTQEIKLYYQAQVDAAGCIKGVESLLRWHHPEHGEIYPDTFIPIAEETGLIHPLGEWAFQTACARIVEWSEAGLGFGEHISVNVCPWQFARPDFIYSLQEIIKAYGIVPARLMLELTESALLYDLDDAIAKLDTLRTLGLKIALDDFGTGYSSLAYLRDLPIDQLKIDKSFIGELSKDRADPLVESMFAIGKHMQITVVAEGVETADQLAVLTAMGCDHFQGFHFCRPLPDDEFRAWLKGHG